MNDSCDCCCFQPTPESFTVTIDPVAAQIIGQCQLSDEFPPESFTIEFGEQTCTYANPRLNDKGEWEYDLIEPSDEPMIVGSQ